MNGYSPNKNAYDNAWHMKEADESFHHDKLIQLQQRLNNIHHFYRSQLQDNRIKTNEQQSMVLQLIDELDDNHAMKVKQMHEFIKENEVENKVGGMVDTRINSIKGSIDQLIKKSNSFKSIGMDLEKKIKSLQLSNYQKQNKLKSVQAEINDAKNIMQSFEIANLKYNKVIKETYALTNAVP